MFHGYTAGDLAFAPVPIGEGTIITAGGNQIAVAPVTWPTSCSPEARGGRSVTSVPAGIGAVTAGAELQPQWRQ